MTAAMRRPVSGSNSVAGLPGATRRSAGGLPAARLWASASPRVRATTHTLGWRLTPAGNAPDLSLGMRATRSESDSATPEHRLGVEVNLRW